MVKPILYGIDGSPPVRAVKLVLAALQLPYDYKVVNVLNKEQHSAEYLKKNPQHTVPMLEDGEACIWDSHAIMSYLVNKYGKDDSLYPKDLVKRARVDQRMHFESGVVFGDAFRSVTKIILFGGMTVVPKERIEAIIQVYDFLEAFLKDHDYMAGDQLTIADFSLISSISSLDIYAPIDSAKYPKLSAWVKRLAKLPYYGENSQGLQQFAAVVKSKLT
ncbi:glutathione S-transferase 1 [Drosophila grimshawi]|uniref:glutathione S-transferase 1 n=1 Tax=Drosophila grimshawi TaxID=7222 RepID=UPI000C8708BA|nr:glutathione S-transferase 1 [Drosophila grimshawi]